MPSGVKPAVGEAPERDGHRRGEVEHVDRAAAPHLAVDDLAAERVALPAVGVHRHDVGVAHQQQRRRVGSVPSMRATRLSRPGLRLVALEVEPASPRYCASRSTLRASSPDASVPSFTHSLRMRCWRRSVTSAVGSSASAHGPRLDLADGAGSRRRAVELGERVLDAAGQPSRGRGATAPSPINPKCSCPQYERIATLSVRFRDSGTTGYTSQHPRAEAVERHLRAGDVGDDEVGEPLRVRGAGREARAAWARRTR